MTNKDFTGLPLSDAERLDAAYAALIAFDKLPPSADALAKLAGVDVEAAAAWLGGFENPDAEMDTEYGG